MIEIQTTGKKQELNHHFLIAVLAFGIMLLISYLVINSTRTYWQEENNASVREYAASQSNLFEQSLNRVFANALILGTLVEQGKGKLENFDRIAQVLLYAINENSNLQLAPNGIIAQVYPLAGQEAALGHNVLKDDKRLLEASLAKNSGLMTLAGPFNLKQGGMGLVARQPVFIEQSQTEQGVLAVSKTFWGFASSMIYLADVLDILGVESLKNAEFDYQLSRIHPDTGERDIFSASTDNFIQTPVRHNIRLPNVTWHLDIAKSTVGISQQWVTLLTFVCLSLSVLTSHWLYTLLHHGQELRQLVEERTEQLRLSNLELQHDKLELVKLSNAVEQSGNAVVIANIDGIIEYVNPRFTEVTGYSANEAIGLKTSLLRSHITTDEEHQQLWQTILAGNSWFGERRNKQKNGNLYWSKMSISPVKDNDGNITDFVCVSEDISDEKEQYLTIQHLAFHDVLTGLPNRRYFVDRLAQTIKMTKRNNEMSALMFIDLDKFKAINDSLGHEVGDLFLIEIAQRLTNTIRETDSIARLGGDEFVVLLPNIGTKLDTEMVAKKLLSNISQTVNIEGHELSPSISIGITLFTDEQDLGANQLIRQADIALYEAKEAGRNTYRFLCNKSDDVSATSHNETCEA